jgi:hypothetical protein
MVTEVTPLFELVRGVRRIHSVDTTMSALLRRCLLVLISGAPLLAQSGNAARGNSSASMTGEAARRLSFLIGDWEGDGWIVLGPGQRRTFHQRESVRAAAGGTVVVIDGLGTSTDAGREGEIVHQAFAVVSYDSASAKLRWRAYRAGGEETVDEPVVGGDSLVWGMDLGPRGQGGRLRFTIRRTTEGAWHETGEMIAPAPNAPSRKFFEMTLRPR